MSVNVHVDVSMIVFLGLVRLLAVVVRLLAVVVRLLAVVLAIVLALVEGVFAMNAFVVWVSIGFTYYLYNYHQSNCLLFGSKG